MNTKSFRVIDWTTQEPKYVRTEMGARRVATKLAKAISDRMGRSHFVTIQERKGQNNWVDLFNVSG